MNENIDLDGSPEGLRGRRDGGGMFLTSVQTYGKGKNAGQIARNKDGSAKYVEGASAKLYFTESQYVEYAFQLAEKIRASGKLPQAIIAPLRGGWIAQIVAQELGLPFYPIYTSTRDPDTKKVKPVGEQYFGYPELPPDIKDVMMVDDMIDDGITGEAIADHFASKKIGFRSAVFFQKIKKRSYTADIVLHDIDDEWVNQPLETKYEGGNSSMEVVLAAQEVASAKTTDTEKRQAKELIEMFSIAHSQRLDTQNRTRETMDKVTPLSKLIDKTGISILSKLTPGDEKLYTQIVRDARRDAERLLSMPDIFVTMDTIVHRWGDFHGMIMAVIISRKLGKPMGTIYPDGKVFYSKAGDVKVADALLVSGDGFDGQYKLSKIEDDIDKVYSNMKNTFGEWISVLELCTHYTLIASDLFPQRILQGVVYKLRDIYPHITFSVKQQATDGDNTRTLPNGIVFEFTQTV